MRDVDYDRDSFQDIIAKDKRFDHRAYALLSEVVHDLLEAKHEHIRAADILEEFKEQALDLFGPMSYTVLTEWGLTKTEDVGEMIFNLVESGRLTRDESDSPDEFAGVYDFREAFLEPYQV